MDREKWCRIINFGVNDGDNDYNGGGDGITIKLRQLQNNQFQTLKENYDDVQSKLANEVIKIASNTTTGQSTCSAGHITRWGWGWF